MHRARAGVLLLLNVELLLGLHGPSIALPLLHDWLPV